MNTNMKKGQGEVDAELPSHDDEERHGEAERGQVGEPDARHEVERATSDRSTRAKRMARTTITSGATRRMSLAESRADVGRPRSLAGDPGLGGTDAPADRRHLGA